MTGKDIIVILSQNGTPMASTRIKSDDIQTQANAIEKASATQQDWEEVIPGRKRLGMAWMAGSRCRSNGNHHQHHPLADRL